MADPNYEALYRQLAEAEEVSPAHGELLRAMEALHQAALPFRRFQGRRKLPLVKARDKTNLMNLHQQISEKAEALLQGENEAKEVKELVRKIAALSSKNYNALLLYNPARAPKTLDSLEKMSQTMILHANREEFDKANKLGANLSERMPLAFMNDKGNKVVGVFTKKSTLEAVNSFHNALDAFIQQGSLFNTADAKAIAQHLKDHLGEARVVKRSSDDKTVTFTEDPAMNVYRILALSTAGEKEEHKTIGGPELQKTLRQLLPEDLAQKLDLQMCSELAEQLNPIRSKISMNLSGARIPENSRLDSRNSAMTAVADMLGMPNIIARSRPMTIVDENGAEIEGTFMELAKGLDYKNPSSLAQYVGKNSLLETDGMALRDIANLQVLDYICGNVDRHGANFTYLFDQTMKFSGVQGIDNDCSFGTRVPPYGEGYNKMVGPKDMRAIPAETFRRVMALKPATLKYALRGFDLSEEELEAAGQRLSSLQRFLSAEKTYNAEVPFDDTEELEPGHIRILEKKDWLGLHINQFAWDSEKKVAQNIFARALGNIEIMKRKWQKQGENYRDLTKTIAAGIKNRANRTTPIAEQRKAAGIQETLSKRSWWGFSSTNYRRMQTAVKNYQEAQKQLVRRLNYANSEEAKRRADYADARNAVVTRADLERMRVLSQRMREAAETYLNGKLINGEIPPDASEYTKQRIDIARQVKDYGLQGENLREEEIQKAALNESKAEKQTQERNALIAAEQPKAPEANPLQTH